VAKVYANFANGMVDQYIAEQSARQARSPLVLNPALSS
jgi:hypothetical protein